jgi:hypothetical protein
MFKCLPFLPYMLANAEHFLNSSKNIIVLDILAQFDLHTDLPLETLSRSV